MLILLERSASNRHTKVWNQRLRSARLLVFDSTTDRDTPTNTGIQWQFITKRAPWHWGFLKRLIGLRKLPVTKVLGKAYINLETLQTVNNCVIWHEKSGPAYTSPYSAECRPFRIAMTWQRLMFDLIQRRSNQ